MNIFYQSILWLSSLLEACSFIADMDKAFIGILVAQIIIDSTHDSKLIHLLTLNFEVLRFLHQRLPHLTILCNVVLI